MADLPAGVAIRPMTAEDVERVLEIAASSPQAPHWQPAAYLTALDAEAAPRRIALVAEREDELAGFAVASMVGEQAELESIAVAAKARRQGVARALLGVLAVELRRLGAEELLLEVRASNQPALELYAGCGFEAVAVRPGYYADPPEDAVLMRSWLG